MRPTSPPNPALNFTPFSSDTVRDKAAQTVELER